MLRIVSPNKTCRYEDAQVKWSCSFGHSAGSRVRASKELAKHHRTCTKLTTAAVPRSSACRNFCMFGMGKRGTEDKQMSNTSQYRTVVASVRLRLACTRRAIDEAHNDPIQFGFTTWHLKGPGMSLPVQSSMYCEIVSLRVVQLQTIHLPTHACHYTASVAIDKVQRQMSKERPRI